MRVASPQYLARRRRPLLAVAAALLGAAVTAGCVSMPTGGPVLSYPVTQGTDAQSQPYVQVVPQPPRPGWSPAEIVEGFLSASASFGDYRGIVNDYLAPGYHWSRSWSAIVYRSGPEVTGPAALPKSAKATVTVKVSGQPQAFLQGYGSYSVPSGSASGDAKSGQKDFQLVRVGKQWRISYAPPPLLLTSDSFANDYQLRNLYFFDPTSRHLVPDPVYVPLQDNSNDLLNGLVSDLIKPPGDWLSENHATRTALPPGTKIRSVTLDGVTAIVNLTGSIAKVTGNTDVMQQVSAQLLRTLADTGQGEPNGHTAQSIELEVDGKAWTPPSSPDNPIQPATKTARAAPKPLYYVDSAGYLNSRPGASGTSVRGLKIGLGAKAIAVSPDNLYLAVLRGTTLYAGRINGPLARLGGGYQSVSWDGNDDLWVSLGDEVKLFRGTSTSRQPLSQAVTVNVATTGPFTALRVAPDGVRVAMIVGGNMLLIGAISGRQGPSPEINFSEVQFKPVNASKFAGLTWYGQDYVITLADPDSAPAATEYPVSGGSTASIPVEPGTQSITASFGNQLVAGLPKGRMVADPSIAGVWTELGTGSTPIYPG